MTEPRPTRGRPRDPKIDALVLDATRQALDELGFVGTTVQEISRRSGVHPPAIYRRWSSKRDLIANAAFADLTAIRIEPTGDLRADLHRFVRAYERALDTSSARAAMPGLLTEYLGEVDPSPSRWIDLSIRPQFYAIAAAAGDEVDPHIDLDDVFDVIQGTILARILVPVVRARRGRIEKTVEYIVRMLRAPAPGPVGDVAAGAPTRRSRATAAPKDRGTRAHVHPS